MLTETELQAQKILSALGPEYDTGESIAEDDLQGILKFNGLDPKSVIKEIRILMQSESPLVRMRGIELAVKLNGMLDKDSEVQGTTFQVILRTKVERPENPILLPRELHNLNVNQSDPLTAADPTTGELINQAFIGGAAIE